ncbi:helix-turn-helix domain-containing protein [Enterococcus gallinarum]|uniref:helix-turn-helix domain-containing protein n=1 Tax=Enterococcus gallinarum TaxID=1353 RepID=UPI00214BB471|nr:helix-turn-helix transcriptional regulator [Enterococcus gallinarum]MCR1932601.1 helix-turn-helix domain-containing protein [Enterococcus gallinarum]
MTMFERVKELAKSRGESLKSTAIKLGYGENYFYSIKSGKSPSAEKLEEIANYFNVSTDYLLGRTDKKNYYELTEKDERDIQRQLEQIVEDLSNAEAIAFSKDSEELSPEARAAVLASLEESLRIGKTLAKKKFTPKKYRNK